MHARRKTSRTGGILPMGKISLTCSHAFFSLRREPGINKEDHSFFRQAWFSSYFNVHRWYFRFKKDFIFKSPLQCNKPAPEVLVSKLSVEYFHMDVSQANYSNSEKKINITLTMKLKNVCRTQQSTSLPTRQWPMCWLNRRLPTTSLTGFKYIQKISNMFTFSIWGSLHILPNVSNLNI